VTIPCGLPQLTQKHSSIQPRRTDFFSLRLRCARASGSSRATGFHALCSGTVLVEHARVRKLSVKFLLLVAYFCRRSRGISDRGTRQR
jgi:hypothetical protein